ncbi:hypothetical protein MXAN_0580 [Myxococcus xanthus DK 1622]|uniref:Uncharacterized protein n=1 Tax=Myxococcus xanthus (strain DK1622) TaxID=246197 RepID=Q1DES5_MYXXD|nr:hypothetical protein MXAN_0580 [Myxococcus xanthus DK 1622]
MGGAGRGPLAVTPGPGWKKRSVHARLFPTRQFPAPPGQAGVSPSGGLWGVHWGHGSTAGGQVGRYLWRYRLPKRKVHPGLPFLPGERALGCTPAPAGYTARRGSQAGRGASHMCTVPCCRGPACHTFGGAGLKPNSEESHHHSRTEKQPRREPRPENQPSHPCP